MFMNIVMFIGGECLYCGRNGHNIRMCTRMDLKERISTMEEILVRSRKKEIKNMLSNMGEKNINILSMNMNIPQGLPLFMQRKMLYMHYKQRMVDAYRTEVSSDEHDTNNG